jgi:diaminopimelate decarboxylase
MQPTDRSNDHVAEIVGRNFDSRDGHLIVDERSIRSLAETYGTPLYVYSRGALDRSWNRLRQALPSEFEIFYSIKANPNQTILRYFLERGCGLEVASAGEIHQAITAGCDPSAIVFAGPGKSDAEIELAVTSGLGEIHVESLSEAERISAISGQTGRRARIALRVNPDHQAQGGAMQMGGKPAPFGIDEEQLDGVLDRVGGDPNLDVSGIHLYVGTQILGYTVLMSQYRKATEIARRVAARLSGPLRTIDFGGGLGIPYFAHEQPLDLAALSLQLRDFVQELKRDPLLKEARLLVEPGRFLVGEAGIYVTRVNEIKRSRGRTFVIVDGGMHQHLAASGNLGQTIKRNFPVALLDKLNHQAADQTVDVVGPLCTPLDMLARDVSLPAAAPGDLFGVFQSGAYARTASPLGFLSHPAPPEIWVDPTTDALIRRRGLHTDLTRDQRDLPVDGGSQRAIPVDGRHVESAARHNSLGDSNE